MNKKMYFKLVRDRIPEFIHDDGKKFWVRQIQDEELTHHALKKLKEEAQEFVDNPCAEEAADLLEVLEFLCKRFKIGASAIKAEQISKHATKGGFDMGFLLEWVEEK